MKKSSCIEFYFDCSSPWTYLAFVEILPLSQRQNVEIIWKPILVGGVFNSVNQDVYQFRENPNTLKLDYSGNDLNLWAKHRNINIFKPQIFPVNSVKAMRGCLFAMQQNCLPLFAQKVFEAYWGIGLDISDEAILVKIAQEAGLLPQDFKQYIYSQEAKDLLMSNSAQLIEKKGFGSPTFFYRDQMFFGNDRLHLLEEVIRKELL
ncbi:2-hydroxychromene-2-carboxylate isomerase [Gammaproteobacteria bacterium]|nr:2-hydroxychromene-2-carboxylate isomerase [Gammaproteobacteria bacterium]MDC0128945.1 2-hydroxychromene-2-carboxylate isomerase [Gammaproteobacteria bacterium]